MKTLTHKFVEYIPQQLEEGILYVTVQYKAAVHLCICGCGNKVITPIAPRSWRLIYDGKTVSLLPSIGNWSFECKSHYWIKENRVVIAPKWEERRPEEVPTKPRKKKFRIFKKKYK